MKIFLAVTISSALLQGAVAFVSPSIHGSFRRKVVKSTTNRFSYGDESGSWWGQSNSFNDDQVQTYVTPRRTKHGALYDSADSIIDLSRWSDGVYVYDQPSYRSGRSSGIVDDDDDHSYMNEPTNNRYMPDEPSTYSQRYAYDEPRSSQVFDQYNDARGNNAYSSDPQYYYEEPYFSTNQYEPYTRNIDYDNYDRRYSSQQQPSKDESSSWWGQGKVFNDNDVQTYVKPRQYDRGDYGSDARAVTETDSWWSNGNVYNENQVQTYTHSKTAPHYHDLMCENMYRSDDHYYSQQQQPQYYY